MISKSAKSRKALHELRDKVLPVIEPAKDGNQPCQYCRYKDGCDHLLEYQWINGSYVLLICAWRMRDFFARKRKEKRRARKK